jgi:hypothetical protein
VKILKHKIYLFLPIDKLLAKVFKLPIGKTEVEKRILTERQTNRLNRDEKSIRLYFC